MEAIGDRERYGASEWEYLGLAEFLRLECLGEGHYRTLYGDSNQNGRAYGGQALGHAVRAAGLTVSSDRAVSMLQLVFLSGIDPARPVELRVVPLQEGRRFSSRHVIGTQDGRRKVFSANVSFAMPLQSPDHSSAYSATEHPESLPRLEEIPAHLRAGMAGLGANFVTLKRALDVRISAMERQFATSTSQSRVGFWLRVKGALPDDPHLRAAAFAYASDWWLSLSSILGHIRDLSKEAPLYVSSLNHCIWFSRPFSPTDWMYFDCESPFAGGGRGLSLAKIYRQDGQMIASTAQENLMVPADGV
jgi:acyl-CoA thioesterase II